MYIFCVSVYPNLKLTQKSKKMKVVVLKLDGNLQQGFRVTLEIGAEGSRPAIDLLGKLPPDEELLALCKNHWSCKYRRVGIPVSLDKLSPNYRIKRKNITYGIPLQKQIQECQESAQKLCERFNAWLRTEPFRALDNCLREQSNPQEAIRLLIRTESRNVQKLPWQEWNFCQRYSQVEITFSFNNFDSIPPPISSCTKPKMRILAIFGYGGGLNLEIDRQFLKTLPHVETVFLEEPEPWEVNEQLWEHSWDLVFFAGHSETKDDQGLIYLNKKAHLSLEELKFAFNQAVKKGLKLAIFNSCDGLGLAQKLSKLPYLIVMRELVPDEVAQEFLKYFLKAFTMGKSLGLAVRQATERLSFLEGHFPCASWLPTIFQHPTAPSLTWQKLLPQENSSTNNELAVLTKENPLQSLWLSLFALTLLILLVVLGVSLGMNILRRKPQNGTTRVKLDAYIEYRKCPSS